MSSYGMRLVMGFMQMAGEKRREKRKREISCIVKHKEGKRRTR